jgi:hypothetical protein
MRPREKIQRKVKKPSSQQKKRKFRGSREWKEFKARMRERQGGTCQITGGKLTKMWQLHHMDLDEENYQVLDEDKFVCLSWNMHKVVHALYVKSKPREWRSRVLRLISILKRMERINGKEGR